MKEMSSRELKELLERGYLIALCDRCAEEEITKEACRARGWIEIPRSHPRVAQEGAWYCQVCGDLL